MTRRTDTHRRRRFTAAVMSVGVLAWTLAAFQPCCEAFAAAAPHEHAPEHHSPSLHHQDPDAQAAERAYAAHAHCVPHAFSAIDPVHGFAALEGPRSQDATDSGDGARPGDAWSAIDVSHLAPPGLPPPGDPGARAYLRFQRFLE